MVLFLVAVVVVVVVLGLIVVLVLVSKRCPLRIPCYPVCRAFMYHIYVGRQFFFFSVSPVFVAIRTSWHSFTAAAVLPSLCCGFFHITSLSQMTVHVAKSPQES